MLKIAIVTNNYKPYSGGVVSSIESFTEQLRYFGHEVLIITLDFLGKGNIENDIYRIKCPIRFIYKNNHIAIPWRSQQSIFNVLQEFSPDIIHSQHPFLLGAAALTVSKNLKIPIVFTYHTQYDKYLHYIPIPEIILETKLNDIILQYCNDVNGVIAPTQSIYNCLIEKKIQSCLEIIPSGILPIFLTEDFKEKKDNQIFHLLTVSRFRKEKNIKFLLDVFSKLDSKKFIFTLIGYGSELENLKSYAFDILKLNKDSIKFIESPSKNCISDYYKLANLFIFSSTTETQGLVLAEAMASGTPVVALNATGSCDIVKNGENGFLVNSVDEMVEKIEFLSTNNLLEQFMQKQAWQTGYNYSSKKMTEKLINFYNLILQKY